MKKSVFKVIMLGLSLCFLVLAVILLIQHGVIAISLPAIVVTVAFIITIAFSGACLSFIVKLFRMK